MRRQGRAASMPRVLQRPPEEADMFKHKRLIVTLMVVGASFVPTASAMAGMNHSETLLLDT
jgi:hypothetical protein